MIGPSVIAGAFCSAVSTARRTPKQNPACRASMIFVMDNTLSELLSRTAPRTGNTLSRENLLQRYPLYFDSYPSNSCKETGINVYLTANVLGFIGAWEGGEIN